MIRSKRKVYAVPPDGAPPESESSHAKIVNLVGHGKRVIEFGCASGYVSSFMKANGCSITGIEINPAAAEEARAHLEEVIVADLDVRSLMDILPSRLFDVAVFGDILEHLRDPWRILDETRSLLGPSGFAVMSIPNVAHGAVRLALLKGTFQYTKIGLLDDDHLRFFTLRSVRELCLRSGYRIDSIDRTKLPLFATSNLVPHVDPSDFDSALIAEIQQDPDHDTLQFIIRAVPLNEEHRVSSLVEQALDMENQLIEAREQLGRQEHGLAALAELRDRLAASEAEVQAGRDISAQIEAGHVEIARLQGKLVDQGRREEELATRVVSLEEIARAKEEREASLLAKAVEAAAQITEAREQLGRQELGLAALAEMRDRLAASEAEVQAGRDISAQIEAGHVEIARLQGKLVDQGRREEELATRVVSLEEIAQADRDALENERAESRRLIAQLSDEVRAKEEREASLLAKAAESAEQQEALLADLGFLQIHTAQIEAALNDNASQVVDLRGNAARAQMRFERDAAFREARVLGDELRVARADMETLQASAIADLRRLTELETLLQDKEGKIEAAIELELRVANLQVAAELPEIREALALSTHLVADLERATKQRDEVIEFLRKESDDLWQLVADLEHTTERRDEEIALLRTQSESAREALARHKQVTTTAASEAERELAAIRNEVDTVNGMIQEIYGSRWWSVKRGLIRLIGAIRFPRLKQRV